METDIEVLARAPGAFSPAELKRFRELIIEGGEVGGAALATNIVNARILVVLTVRGMMRGVAALKCPQNGYRKKVANWTSFELSAADYPYELGYVYIQPTLRGRGLSHRLIASTLQHNDARGVFATVRMDNKPMRTTFAKAGFAAEGADYPGTKGDRIGLLIRSA